MFNVFAYGFCLETLFETGYGEALFMNNSKIYLRKISRVVMVKVIL